MNQPFNFTEIPRTRIPGIYAEFNTLARQRLLPGNEHTVLIIGQANAGSAQSVNDIFDIYSADQVGAECGFGSLMHRMVLAMVKVNPYLNLQGILLNDSAWANAASLAVALDDVDIATTAGMGELRINKDLVRVDITKDMTGAQLKAAWAAAINADLTLPLTAAVSGAGDHDLIFTSKTAGWVGGRIKISARITATGFDLTLASGTLTTVSTKPEAADITAILERVKAAGHTLIVMPYAMEDQLVVLKDHLDFVSNGVEKRGARASYASATNGTAAAAKALSTNNYWRLMNVYYHGSRSWEPEIAAAALAQVAAQQDPGMPLNDLPLKGIDAPDLVDRITRTIVEDLLRHGVTPLYAGPGNVTQYVRAISTYTKTANNVADDFLMDFTMAGVADYVRRACVEAVQLQFPRVKRSDRVLRQIRSLLIKVLKKLEELELIENVDEHLPDLVVLRDPQDQFRANARIPAAIIPGLHVVGMLIDLL